MRHAFISATVICISFKRAAETVRQRRRPDFGDRVRGDVVAVVVARQDLLNHTTFQRSTERNRHLLCAHSTVVTAIALVLKTPEVCWSGVR